jgi:Lrp/AsnC family leucine-responsive transcriptional regulator
MRFYVKTDNVDLLILNELAKNGRESASNIAELIGMSIPAVTERIKKLQDSGVIKGYNVELDKQKLGMDVSAFITIISESSAYFEDVVKQADNNLNVIKCYTTTGIGSHILHVEVENTVALEKILRDIQSWPGVKRTETQLILSSYKNTNSLIQKEKQNVSN